MNVECTLKYSVALAITVIKENVDLTLSRVVPPDSGPLWGGRRATLLNILKAKENENG